MGAQFGNPAGKEAPAPVSELRFRRLLSARDHDEVYTQLRRLLPLVKNKVNLACVAEVAYGWSDKTRWKLAHDYYSAAPKAKKN